MLKIARQSDHLSINYKIHLVLLVTIGLSITMRLTSAQTTYKWIDDSGSVHFGGTLPANITEFNALRVENAPNNEAARAPSSSEDKIIPRERKNTQDKQNKLKYATKSADQICALYKKKLNHYISRMRAGYEAKQYNHLEGKRREYRRKLWQSCREGPFVQPDPNNT